MNPERVYAYIDESGSFGWNLDNDSTSRFFILTAVIVQFENIPIVREQAEKIKQDKFGKNAPEMKSSNIGTNYKRRYEIVSELSKLPYKIFSVVVDKESLKEDDYPGLRYKKSFYKFLNNILYRELIQAFPKININADSSGDSDFMKSFLDYMNNKAGIPDLFNDRDINLSDSKNEIIIQIADIVSGTLAYAYDEKKHTPKEFNYLDLLKEQIIRIEMYPYTIANFDVNTSAIASEYDKRIAAICYNCAKNFLVKNVNSKDEDIIAQMMVLKYLLFRFMNNDQRDYIQSNEIMNYLRETQIGTMSNYKFRNRIIAKLRDEGVIIASSSNGYKIPTNEKDLYNFISHDNSIVIPMLYRLKKCRDIIYLGTNKELDVLNKEEFVKLNKIFDTLFPNIEGNS